ncbi:hypothetical protein RRG08_013085 [Elysia crispata]|uniref:Uncharacterized protein n=1 Tax=Elysia crispata TaxID=231223 RepID=A0AAE1DQB7_9GAST|nr:hypothetical protein RRG08_013085 [Elysia crispata]
MFAEKQPSANASPESGLGVSLQIIDRIFLQDLEVFTGFFVISYSSPFTESEANKGSFMGSVLQRSIPSEFRVILWTIFFERRNHIDNLES